MKQAIAFALGALLWAASQYCVASEQDLLIRQVRLVSLEEHQAVLSDVLIRDGAIAWIGPSPYLPADPGDAEPENILDGQGRFLSPGLIDGHTHLNEIPGMTSEHEAAYPDIARQARDQIPRSYLFHGFTTVIDLNSAAGVIADWNAVEVRPQAYFCGAAPVVDGYPMSWMPKPQRYQVMPYFLFDPERAADFPEGYNAAHHSPEAVAQRIKSDGGICVKTHWEKGFGGRGDLPVPTPGLAKQLVSAAHSSGLPVMLHANSQAAQAFGIEVGVDGFAHGMWTWDDRQATTLSAPITDLVDAAIARGIALQATIQVLYGEQDIHNPDYLADPRLREVLPDNLINWYTTEDGQWWRQRMLEIPPVARLVEQGLWAELDAPPIARVSATLRHFVENGGTLLFGSDTPSDPTFANPPGLNGRLEMDRLIAAGVTPRQLFAAATTNNTGFFGLEDRGVIEVGKRADLLLLERNPLESANAYDSITHVVLKGVVHQREALSAAKRSLSP